MTEKPKSDPISFPEAWAKLARRELGDKPLEGLVWDSPEGIAIKPLYTAADLEGLEGLDTLPGFAPFTRRVRGTMSANRPRPLRQYAGFSTAEDPKASHRNNLAAGPPGASAKGQDARREQGGPETEDTWDG